MRDTIALGDLVEFPLPPVALPAHDGSAPPAEPAASDVRPRLWKVVGLEPEHRACTIEREEHGEPDWRGLRSLLCVQRWVFVDEVRRVEVPAKLRSLV